MHDHGTSDYRWHGLRRTMGRIGWMAATALALPLAGRAAIEADSFLQTAGTVIKDHHGAGRVVTLRGTNLGGWMMQEDWMSPNGYGRVGRRSWITSAGADGLTINLCDWCTFGRLELASSGQVTIEVSNEGKAWSAVRVRQITPADGRYEFDLDRGYTARWIRLRRADGAPIPPFEAELEQNDDYTVRMALQERFGGAAADRLIRGYQRTWIDAHDLDTIKSWGMNVVRAPMNWLDFMTPEGKWKADAFAELDWLVSACAARSLYVILDLHAVPGGASPWASSGHAGDDGTGQNPNGFWTNPGYQLMAEHIWHQLAEHFRGNPTIAGYDLVNEPLERFDERPQAGETYSAAVRAKSAYLDRLYRAVRAVDPDHIVFIAAYVVAPPNSQAYIGTPSGFLGITPPSYHHWTNVVYQTHHYDMTHPQDHDAQARLAAEALADIARHQREWNVPIYAGEYTFYHFYDVWETWMKGLNGLHVSWTNWTYKVRGTADDPAGVDWGFFHTNRNPVPDVARDSAETIAAKWAKFGTDQFQRNDALIEVVSRCAAAADTAP